MERFRVFHGEISSLETKLEDAIKKGDIMGAIGIVQTYSKKYLPKSKSTERPKKSKTEKIYDKLGNPLDWYGYDSLGDAVNLYVYENRQIKKFGVKDLAKYFGTNSAPIYHALKARPDLMENGSKGNKSFARSPK